MNVALVARGAHPLHEPGGMERAVYHLAKQLRERRHGVTLYTRPALHAKPFPGTVAEVAYRRWRVGRHGSVLDRTVNYPGFADRVGAQLAGAVREGRIDIVDAQGMAVLGYLRRRQRNPLLRAPVLVNPQGMEEHKVRGIKRLRLTLLRRLSRETARLADRVVATDDILVPEIPRYLGVSPEKVVLLRNGVDLEEIAQVTPRDPRLVVDSILPNLGAAHPALLSVGRLERYKGFGDVLSALLALHEASRLPRDWAWVILGDGSLRPELHKRISEWDRAHGSHPAGALRPHVHFAGWIRELPVLHAFYARSAVFVHGTHYEGSSIVTIEAMSHSLPVVATRAGGIPDKVIDGRNGYLVEPRDVAGLREALGSVMDSEDVRRSMGTESRARAEQLFSWRRIAEETIAVYTGLVGREAARGSA